MAGSNNLQQASSISDRDLSFDQNLSAVGNVEPSEAREQRRFSASRGPDKRDELSGSTAKLTPRSARVCIVTRVVNR